VYNENQLEKQGRKTMNEYEKMFLQDTIDILINYDGCHTIDTLKGLIDETGKRLIKLSLGEVKEEDLGIEI
jgi:hypothetical protein